MDLKLQQAICLSLAGGFAIVAPPSFPRNRSPLDVRADGETESQQNNRAAEESHPAPNTRSRNK
jgi:hypothetical protein